MYVEVTLMYVHSVTLQKGSLESLGHYVCIVHYSLVSLWFIVATETRIATLLIPDKLIRSEHTYTYQNPQQLA